MVSIFFNLEKAYDTTWKYGIMRDLHDMDLRGRLPLFICIRKEFRVTIATSLSVFYDQEMGVLQSSILSVTLFIEMVLTNLYLLKTLVFPTVPNTCRP